MSAWHGYIGLENVGLAAVERTQLNGRFRGLGPAADRQPARRNHGRPRLDGEAMIVEAAFDAADLSAGAVKGHLAAVLGVDPATVSQSAAQGAYGPLLTFSQAGADRLRLLLFGGLNESWERSRRRCRQYLRDHLNQWEGAPGGGP